MRPVAYKRKSPVDKAAKVRVQVPGKAIFLNCLFKNKIQDLIYRWRQQEHYK